MRFPLFSTFHLWQLLALNHFPAMSHDSNAFPIISQIELMTNSCFESFSGNVPRLKCVFHYFPNWINNKFMLWIIFQQCPTTQMRFPLVPTFHLWQLLAMNHFPAMSQDSNAFLISSHHQLMTNLCFKSFSGNVPRLKCVSHYLSLFIYDNFLLWTIFRQCPTTQMRFQLYPTFNLWQIHALNHFPAMSYDSNAFPIIFHFSFMTTSCFESFSGNVLRLKCVSYYFPLFFYNNFLL